MKCGVAARSPTSGSSGPRRRDRDGLHRPLGLEHLAFAGAIPDEDLVDAVDESYRLVVEGLPKKLRPGRLGGGLVVPARLAGDGSPTSRATTRAM